MSDGIHIETDEFDDAPIPGGEARYADEVGDAESLPDEDVEAEEDVELEADGYDIPDDAQPDSQGEDPLIAELGEDGQGDLAPEDE